MADIRLIKIPVEGDVVEFTIDDDILNYRKTGPLDKTPAGVLFNDPEELIEKVNITLFSKWSREFRGDYLDVHLIVHESGLLRNLPLNQRASWLYGIRRHGQPIVGDAYVVATDWSQPDLTKAPERVFVGVPREFTLGLLNDFTLLAAVL